MTATLIGTAGPRTSLYRLASGVALLAAPSAADDHVDMIAAGLEMSFDDIGVVIVTAVTGTGITVASLRACGRDADNGWGPLGTGSSTSRGLMNGGASIVQVGTYPCLLREEISGLWKLTRFGLEMGAVTGTGSPTVNVDLMLCKRRY